MGFRTVVVNPRCKLEFRLNFLIVRGEQEKRIYINEINVLIIESTAVSLTAALMSELIKNNVTSTAVKQKISANVPPDGVVEMLEVTENQFSRIEYLVGNKQTLVEESMDRLIEV